MPVLYAGRNVNAIAGSHLDRFLAPFLIVSASCNADEDLTAALVSVVNVPVVAALRLKGHIENAYLLGRNRSKIALTNEKLRKSIVRSAYREHHFRLMCRLCIANLSLVRP